MGKSEFEQDLEAFKKDLEDLQDSLKEYNNFLIELEEMKKDKRQEKWGYLFKK
jgi:hypothetical protein